jgi:hypothetical protein
MNKCVVRVQTRIIIGMVVTTSKKVTIMED